MAWNPPSNDQKPDAQDPWTGRPKQSPSNGPPLLEDLIKKIFKRLGGAKPSGFSKKIPPKVWAISGFLFFILLWALAGFHRITPNQEALVFRLGLYQKNLETGWHWLPWGVDQLVIFDRDQPLSETFATDVISQDNNLAHITLKLSYHVNDAKNYYLNVEHAPALIKAAVSMALQQTVANNNLDVIFSDDKNTPFMQALQQNIAKALDNTSLGIQLNQIDVVDVAVPPAVKEIFNKIDALYNEQEKQKEKAADYEKQVLPPARVRADQLIADAKSYAVQAKLKAQSEVADFLAVLPAYEKAPAVTRYRLYSQTMQEILSKTTKVVVDENSHGANIYLTPAMNALDSASPPIPSASAIPNPSTSSAPETSDSTDVSTTDNVYANVKGGY